MRPPASASKAAGHHHTQLWLLPRGTGQHSSAVLLVLTGTWNLGACACTLPTVHRPGQAWREGPGYPKNSHCPSERHAGLGPCACPSVLSLCHPSLAHGCQGTLGTCLGEGTEDGGHHPGLGQNWEEQGLPATSHPSPPETSKVTLCWVPAIPQSSQTGLGNGPSQPRTSDPQCMSS